ncbi:MAG: hypothetical protein LAO51_20205 [Acidobacteriia bacterium]|nr:hypothetical protein [Terriglobia bacterium]
MRTRIILVLAGIAFITIGAVARADDPPAPTEDPITAVEILVAPEAALTIQSEVVGDLEREWFTLPNSDELIVFEYDITQNVSPAVTTSARTPMNWRQGDPFAIDAIVTTFAAGRFVRLEPIDGWWCQWIWNPGHIVNNGCAPPGEGCFFGYRHCEAATASEEYPEGVTLTVDAR